MSDFLHGFFARAAARWPDRTAVDAPPTSRQPQRRIVTYAQLNTWSNALASHLAPLLNGESVVAILLPRSADVYAAQLAVLKAGAAYTCIDPQFPDERARWILEDANAVALITDAAGGARARSAGWNAPIVRVEQETLAAHAAGPNFSSANTSLTPSSLAYLIYTSGTTGRPKGVAVEHRSIANLVASDIDEFGLNEHDRVAQNSSTSYDSSIEELWMAFAVGAAVVVVDDETARMGPDIVPWLRRERVTVFCPPPTLLRASGCKDPQAELPELKLLYVGGEALPRDVLDAWAPGRRLSNGYGPTECSVTAVRCDVTAGEQVAIGWPVKGVTAFVLDDTLTEVPAGERGELCLGGAGLARGYWKRPELTADRFIVHPTLGRLYRTGDLAHQEADGRLLCHGRLDSQVKIRGYRIELDEIDAALQQCEGVREAASVVDPTGAQAALVAFIVPQDPAHPPSVDALKAALSKILPSYMVPARVGFIDALPRSVGGKLNRAALPVLAASAGSSSEDHLAPVGPIEHAIAGAMKLVLGRNSDVSTDHDFFTDLGGDSLTAAMLVTRLRDAPATSWVAVRDVYESRTVAALAERAPATDARPTPATATVHPHPTAKSTWSTVVQSLCLLIVNAAASVVAYIGACVLLPWLTERMSLRTAVLLMPPLAIAALTLYAPIALLFAVFIKRIVIGRYEAMRAPVWGSFYVRHWIVLSAVRLVPWRTMQGTVFHAAALRALGARIGERVHIHRGVDLAHGGWDLLTIGDDVSIGQDAVIGLVELDDGQIVAGPVTIESGAVLDVRSGVAGGTVVGANAHLSALSSLPVGGVIPSGERWDGVPARAAGLAASAPALTDSASLSPAMHGLLLIAAENAVSLLKWLPLAALSIAACTFYGVESRHVWQWIASSTASPLPAFVTAAMLVISVPCTLVIEALMMRALGRVQPGVISAWSLAHIRVWLKTGILDSAGNWLSGTLFWPVWLRAAGMKLGRRCEISTITDVVPELVTFGEDVFLADGIYLAGPRVQQGAVTLAATRLGARTFLGNHVVIPIGQQLPDDILLGVCTVADDAHVRTGTSWFGHPPFELPRREVVDVDRAFTHEPSAIRYWNRVFWESLRIALPVVPGLIFIAWLRIVVGAQADVTLPVLIGVVVPLATVGTMLVLCGVVLAAKWLLIGRVKPGQHPLWSCWCSRWDFLYVMWNLYATPSLASLEGTLLLPWYLRAMGMKIGRGVVLGPGFAQVVDPDMISIDDEATVHAMFQAHTFEDRVLKIDYVRIGKHATLANGTVVLYGADIGDHTHVAPHSVVMKQERLLPQRRYEGAPTKLV